MTAQGPPASAIAITALLSRSLPITDLIVIGGGPAGLMAAITAAESGLASVLVLEATAELLAKVRISGGGRCNVTHACWDPKDLVNYYPRGSKPLRGPFSRFACGDAVAWFAEHGLELKEEADGRMFPVANCSSAVVDCLSQAASAAGVRLQTDRAVEGLKRQDEQGFLVQCRSGSILRASRVLLATGGHASGRKLAAGIGHTLVPPVPSLFSLSIREPSLQACSGTAVDAVELTLDTGDQRFVQTGRVLITHRGLSGPATLALSAFAARELHQQRYQADLRVNWSGGLDRDQLQDRLMALRRQQPRRTLTAARPVESLPRRLWQALLVQVAADPQSRWGDCPARLERSLVEALVASPYRIQGRGPYLEEFVTAGGIALEEVDLVKMESRLCPGLHFAGELLDVDGLTGGFNFQHCWTSGWLAGQAIAKSVQLAT